MIMYKVHEVKFIKLLLMI